MFIDKATIHIQSGNGGDGAIAWRREKYEPAGGPDGGDGGDGGSIIMEASDSVQTLLDFKYQRHFRAQSGENGQKKKQFGKKGEDLVLKVPVGTVVREKISGKPIYDFKHAGERFEVLKGGRGGRGNARFKNSIRQAPRFAKPGGMGRSLDVVLEIKLIADIGLVGLPNVGKSTLLSILTNAKPKIANYHFTTLDPNLGVVDVGEGHSFVMADIPGLIEGAGEGCGLGHEFLRHIERTGALVHVVDIAGSEGRDPYEDFLLIQKELAVYNKELAEKVQIVIANKMDLPQAEENLEEFRKKCDLPIYPVSAATTQGVLDLKYVFWELIKEKPKTYETLDEEIVDVESFFRVDRSISIRREGDTILVRGEPVAKLARRLIMTDEDSVNFFERSLEEMGIMERIRQLEPTEEDTIDVEGFIFEWL